MAAKKTYDRDWLQQSGPGTECECGQRSMVREINFSLPTSTHRANSDKKSATFNQEKLIFNYQLSFFTAFLASFSANSLDLSPSPFNS